MQVYNEDMAERNQCCSFCCCCGRDVRDVTIQNDPEIPEATCNEISEVINTHDLPQPLLTGHLITVIGNTLPHCSRFSINFKCGKTVNAETAFHFNPRLEENYIVRNTFINGRWGSEETTSSQRLDWKKPGTFKIDFFMAPQEFLVSIDDKYFCSYKFRVALTKVSVLTVHGNVSVESVGTSEASEYPLNVMNNTPMIELEQLVHNGPLANPYTARLPVGLLSNWQVEILGRVKLLPQSFYVNLQEGAQIWPHPQIPMHLNPRFYGGQHSVVRNAWHRGTWGHEERVGSQFSPGHPFHLVIRLENDEFSVWINGKMAGLFKSKTSHINIDTLHVQGDVILYKVWLNTQVQNILINMENYSRDVMNGIA